MVVDYGRSCYNTVMAFDEAGLLTAPVRWYFAEPGAKQLPFQPHLFVSSRWDRTGFIPLGPGELWNVKPTWNNGALPGPLYGRGSPCGPEDWWTNGCPSDAPRLVLDSRGLPTCCGVPPPLRAGIKVGAQIPVPVCQPWFTHTVVRSMSAPGYSHPLGRINTQTFGETWGPGTPFFTVIAFSSAVAPLCGTQPKAFMRMQDMSGSFSPNTFNFNLVSYNPATHTGTWAMPSFVTGPAGFSTVLFTCPP